MLETVFDVGEGFVELFDEPVEFPFLSGEVYQYPRRGNVHSHCAVREPVLGVDGRTSETSTARLSSSWARRGQISTAMVTNAYDWC